MGQGTGAVATLQVDEAQQAYRVFGPGYPETRPCLSVHMPDPNAPRFEARGAVEFGFGPLFHERGQRLGRLRIRRGRGRER